MEQNLTLDDFLDVFRRRAWILVLCLLIGLPFSVLVAYLLPPVYVSSATILVESEQIPADLARSTVTASVSERLQQIEQRLMTRENLLAVAERLRLFADRPDMTPTEKVAKMRAATAIQSVGLAGSGRRGPVTVTTFKIAYEAERADTAARVANEFVTMALEQNLQVRNERASETRDFFQREVDRLAGELIAIEGRITAYKQNNEAALPESLGFRRDELADLDDRMFERTQRRLELAEAKRVLEQSLATGSDVQNLRPLTEEEKQLQALELAYAQQSAIYSESHPTMQAMANRLKVLRERVNRGESGDGGLSVREAEIRRQIDVIDNQLALLEEQRAADEARKVALETSIARTPEVEMALNALLRRQSELQTQYQQVVLKRADAETGEKLEINRQAERFEVIEQAVVPEAPVAPNRKIIAIGGVFGWLAVGVGLMALAEFAGKTIHTPRQLERALNLRPIVTIPYIETAKEVHRRRLRMAAGVVGLLVIVPGGLYALDQYYLPLPLVAERMLERTGLDEVVQLVKRRL